MVLSAPASPCAAAESARGGLVLWVVPVADLGGVARHVIDVARAGIPGWRLIVLCPEGPLAVRLRTLGTAVVTGPVSPANGAATATRTIRRTLRNLRPEVLHTHLAFADLAGIAAAAGMRSANGRRLRVVSTEHGISGVYRLYQSSGTGARMKTTAHRARLLRTDRVIAVSESTAEQVAAQWGSREKITVIRNGVDGPAASIAPRPGLRFLSLARLAPEKRIDHLLRAFAVLAAEHADATLTVAGTGPEGAMLETLAQALGVSDRVTFPGHVDAVEALAAHDVVVQLSAWENLSYTLLDAVAHGLGVVATDVGGNSEIVPEQCLVAPDDVQAVASSMISQGTRLEHRPTRTQGVCVAEMNEAIAGVYAEVA